MSVWNQGQVLQSRGVRGIFLMFVNSEKSKEGLGGKGIQTPDPPNADPLPPLNRNRVNSAISVTTKKIGYGKGRVFGLFTSKLHRCLKNLLSVG